MVIGKYSSFGDETGVRWHRRWQTGTWEKSWKLRKSQEAGDINEEVWLLHIKTWFSMRNSLAVVQELILTMDKQQFARELYSNYCQRLYFQQCRKTLAVRVMPLLFIVTSAISIGPLTVSWKDKSWKDNQRLWRWSNGAITIVRRKCNCIG